MSVILETKQLCKFYGAGENQVKAVNQVDIQIEQGEFVAIVGKSGSGKRDYKTVFDTDFPLFWYYPVLCFYELLLLYRLDNELWADRMRLS